jgi:uncharacterized protein with von Willebrand factor type A (vWA) domain
VTARAPRVERLHLFVDELRARGSPISMVERVDAMRAAELADLADLADRHALHTNLGATLVKNGEHLSVFDEVFDIFFRMSVPLVPATTSAPAAASGGPQSTECFNLARAMREVLQDGSVPLARQVVEQAVARYARFEPGRPAGGDV